jgi:hypothetical protein
MQGISWEGGDTVVDALDQLEGEAVKVLGACGGLGPLPTADEGLEGARLVDHGRDQLGAVPESQIIALFHVFLGDRFLKELVPPRGQGGRGREHKHLRRGGGFILSHRPRSRGCEYQPKAAEKDRPNRRRGAQGVLSAVNP